MDHVIVTRKPDLALINKEKRICYLVDFAVQADQIKESEKINKHMNFARKLKKLCNLKMTVMPIIVGALRTVPNRLEKRLAKMEIRGKIENIQTIALLRSARILRRVLETWGDLLLLKLEWKTTSKCRCEKITRSEIIMRVGMTRWESWPTGNCARNQNFEHIDKYMHKPESIRENEIHTILFLLLTVTRSAGILR